MLGGGDVGVVMLVYNFDLEVVIDGNVYFDGGWYGGRWFYWWCYWCDCWVGD